MLFSCPGHFLLGEFWCRVGVLFVLGSRLRILSNFRSVQYWFAWVCRLHGFFVDLFWVSQVLGCLLLRT